MSNKFTNFWKRAINYIKHLIVNWRTTLPAFLMAETIFWIPVWLPTLLYFILKIEWLWTISVSVVIFWSGPFTPAIGLQLAFIALFERWFTKHQSLKRKEKLKDYE